MQQQAGALSFPLGWLLLHQPDPMCINIAGENSIRKAAVVVVEVQNIIIVYVWEVTRVCVGGGYHHISDGDQTTRANTVGCLKEKCCGQSSRSCPFGSSVTDVHGLVPVATSAWKIWSTWKQPQSWGEGCRILQSLQREACKIARSQWRAVVLLCMGPTP